MRRPTSPPPATSRRIPFSRVPTNVKLAWAAWVILVLDPHWWLASLGVPQGIAARLHFVPLGLLSAYLLFQPQRIRQLTPLTLYAIYVVLTTPFAFIRGMAMPYMKLMIVTALLSLAVLTFLRRAPYFRFALLALLLYRYVWFGIHGIAIGRVPWDPLIGNQDQFGSIMAMGLVSAAALGMGATDRKTRNIAAGTALLCAGGLVSSFARGAFLAGAIALSFLWYRAKGRRLGYAVTVALIVGATAVAGSFFSNVDIARGGGSTSFWTEISSIGTDIANPQEEERQEVWRIGWHVFLDNPVFGVGGRAWGAYAARTYENDYELMGDRFMANPNRLWGRAMHNAYLQQLAEHGAVGMALFLWILWDFWRKNWQMRRRSHKEEASVLPGLRTRMVAAAFEASMVALLAAGMLYNVLNIWFYAMIIAQTLFYQAWVDQRAAMAAARR